MRLTLLGTGTPAPSLKRMGSGYLIETGGDTIVFDHGPGAHHRLLETGRRAVDVTHCFLTHLHYDHCMDYARLVMNRWDQGAGASGELQVFGPPPTARMTDLLFSPEGVYARYRGAHPPPLQPRHLRSARGEGERARPDPQVREIGPGDVVEGGDWRVTVGEGWHFQPYLQCLAYRIDTDAGSVCYSGDSGGVCPGIVELARGADVLVHMNHFFTGTEPSPEYRRACGNHMDTAQVAAEAGVATLVLTHITAQIDTPVMRSRILREMAPVFGGDIVWGEDLMEVPVRQTGLGRID